MHVTDFKSRVATLSPEKRALLEQALQRRREHAIPPRADEGPAPLSFSQQRIWFLEQWEPGTPTNHGVRVFRLRGGLDVDALKAAFACVIARHEILRTVYRVIGREPRQVVLQEWALELPVVELTQHTPKEQEVELNRLLRAQAREPFDLERDLIVRTTLFRLGEDDHVLLVRLHHIAYDAWSDRVLLTELSESYNGAAEPAELPIQYADFAVWQRDTLQGKTLADLVSYWRETLAGAPATLRLPTDRSRPTVQRHHGSHHHFSLAGELAEGVVALAREEGATPYMGLLAAFATLLHRVGGERDVVVGSPVACRNRVELESLVGFFSNTLVLRNRLEGNPSFREVVRRTRAAATSAYAHQELPFERIVEELNIPRDPSYNPVFQVNFRAQAAEPPALRLAGVEAEPLTVDIGFSRFDLALELRLLGDRIDGYFEYDHDLFDPSTIELLTADLEGVLAQVSADPDRPISALKVATPARHATTMTTIPRARAS
jgi:hypothetical protein